MEYLEDVTLTGDSEGKKGAENTIDRAVINYKSFKEFRHKKDIYIYNQIQSST